MRSLPIQCDVVCLVGLCSAFIHAPFFFVNAWSTVTVITRSSIAESPQHVQDFLASPGNWPKIVSSSMGVSSEEDVDRPLPVGKSVDEVFGLPPIIPLSVEWTCTQSSPPTSRDGGRLEFLSENGLKGVASNCAMVFDVTQQQNSTTNAAIMTNVVLQMTYNPTSILAVLARPLLTLDNTIALQFLLPAAIRQQPELDKFRNLMGVLYGMAGLAHLADCLVGDSQLLATAGAPVFHALPFTGQIVAILWCGMGPVAFALRGGKGFADVGLILYGLVEVVGAGLVQLYYNSAIASSMTTSPLLNAVGVQAIVALAWFYSANKAQKVD